MTGHSAEIGASDPLGIVTPNPRPRCHFGRPHGWAYINWTDDGRRTPDGVYVKCFACGQVEVDQ